MASKWLNKKKFKEFAEQKANENDNTNDNENQMYYRKWRNPVMGNHGKPKEYEIRLIPDKDNELYQGYFYHMFQVGETWKYFKCPKTEGLDKYCPWCQIAQILYKGTASDKKKARDYSRKQKFVSNVFIVNDPRDSEETDEERKVSGTVRLYEFPPTVEKMFKKEVTDKKNGYGMDIFNPEEDGYNFILTIEAKKPDANGKVWPDYSQSMFNRRPSPIADSEEELEKIMETRISVKEYLDSLAIDAEEHKKLLKAEMIWDDVCDEFERRMGVSESKKVDSSDKETVEDDKTDDNITNIDIDGDDDELLNELDNL